MLGLLLLGICATVTYVALTFIRLRVSNLFLDFTVFLSSIIIATLSNFFATEQVLSLSLSIFLYINSVWLYGVESREVLTKRYVFNPSISRVFIGTILFIIALWLSFSQVDIRVAIITILISIILSVHKAREISKK